VAKKEEIKKEIRMVKMRRKTMRLKKRQLSNKA